MLDQGRHDRPQLLDGFSRPEDNFREAAAPAALKIDRRGQRR